MLKSMIRHILDERSCFYLIEKVREVKVAGGVHFQASEFDPELRSQRGVRLHFSHLEKFLWN